MLETGRVIRIHIRDDLVDPARIYARTAVCMAVAGMLGLPIYS